MVEKKLRQDSIRYVPVAQRAVTTDPATTRNTGKTLVFSYDALNRLASASTTAASSTPFRQTYGHTAIGNIASTSDLGSYLYAGMSLRIHMHRRRLVAPHTR